MRYTPILAALFVLVLGISICPAGQILDAVPEDAVCVIRLRTPKDSFSKAIDFIGAVNPIYGDLLRGRMTDVGALFENGKLAGVDRTRDWYVALFDGKGAQPVFLVPTTDHAALKEALDDESLLMEHDGFAIYTRDAPLLDRVRETLDGKRPAVTPLIDKASAALLESADLGLFINVRPFLIRHADELTTGQEKLLKETDKLPAARKERVKNWLKSQIETTFQSLRDVRSLTVAVHCTAEEIQVEVLLRVGDDSVADRLLQKAVPQPIDEILKLPAGGVMYSGASGIWPWSLSDLADLLLSSDQDQSGFETVIVNLLKGLSKVHIESYAGVTLVKTEEHQGWFPNSTIVRTSTVDEFRKLYTQAIRELSAVQAPEGGTAPAIEQKTDDIAGQPADKVTIQAHPSDGDDKLPAELLKEFLGSEGYTQRSAYLKDFIVTTMNGGKPLLETSLAVLNNPQPSAALVAARKQLPEKVNLITMVDLPKLVVETYRVAARSINKYLISLNDDEVENGDSTAAESLLDPDLFGHMKLPESYLVAGAATEPGGVRFHLIVPVAQAQGLNRIFTVAIASLLEQNKFIDDFYFTTKVE